MKSDTSVCSQESEDLNSDLKEPMLYQLPHGTNPGGMKKIAGAISQSCWEHNNLLVSGNLNSINTPAKSSREGFRLLGTGETAQKSTHIIYQTLICSVEVFLAKHSQSLENAEDLKTLEVLCFLKLREFLKLKDLKLYSLKMSKAYSITTKGRLLESSFKRWMNWGMKFNGWYLTANFSEFPRTERGYSLSEILEENPDQKYYLSDAMTRRLLEKGQLLEPSPQGDIQAVSTQTRQQLSNSINQPTQMTESIQKKELAHLSTQPREETDNQILEQSSHQTEKRNDKTEEDSKNQENHPSQLPGKTSMESVKQSEAEEEEVCQKSTSGMSLTRDVQSEDSRQSNAVDSKDFQTTGTNMELMKKEKELK